MLLSAVLIVKNEEQFLEGCLSSLRNFVDEIIVVDTGSADRSIELAQNAGAQVHQAAWTDDFSAARNCAIELAKGEWILSIDADEQVRAGSSTELRSLLANTTHIGCHVLLHPGPRFTPFWALRLFRNKPDIRFQGIIHESIWPAIHSYPAASTTKAGRCDLVLDHQGYEGGQEHKHRRNLPLLESALRRDPSQVYCWCHLAEIHLALGRNDLAESAWNRALEVVRTKKVRIPHDSLPYVGLLQWASAQGLDMESLMLEAQERFPDNIQIIWLRGRSLMSAERFADALAFFERLVVCGQTGEFDHFTAYDKRLFDIFSYDSLATCYFRLARYPESRRYYKLAAQCDPGRLEYRVKQGLCLRLQEEQSARSAKI